MYIEQIYTKCLAQASYYIESNGEVAIIDPIRDTQVYLDKAKERGAKITYILETHFHADFVSGHLDLQEKSKAELLFGPQAETDFPKRNLNDGEVIALGDIKFKTLYTPGHTPESTCYLLVDAAGKNHALFSGDTLFVGDVGRPDLLDGKMNKEDLAAMMYDSLRNKIMPLADDVILYPGHGPGSSCGKNLGSETSSTIGTQKATNYALQEMSKEDFVETICSGISPAPAYFFEDAKLNKKGYPSLESLLEKGKDALTLKEFETLRKGGIQVLDTRNPDDFEMGFIPKSINIGLNGQFAIWAGTMLALNQPLLIVADAGKEEEVLVRLARVGFSKIEGFLKGGFETWRKAGNDLDMVISITPEEFALDYKHSDMVTLDVRKDGEWETSHLEDAIHANLQHLEEGLKSLDKSKEYAVHCAGGYRSMIAASLLKANGFTQVKNVYKGWSGIQEYDLPTLVSSKEVTA